MRFVSSKCDKRFAVEVDNEPLKWFNRIIFPTFVQSMYISFQLLDLPKAQYNTRDQRIIIQSLLELVYLSGLQEMEDICVEVICQNCQMDQLRSQLKPFWTF